MSKIVLEVPTQSGQVEFGCFVEGHYEGGMRGVIVVASSGTGVTGSTGTPRASAPQATPVPGMSGHPTGMDEEQH